MTEKPPAEVLQRFGIDPDDPQALERATLASYLHEQGVPPEELREAGDMRAIALLAWRRVFGVGGRIVPVEEVARRTGLPTDVVERVLRALGFPDLRLTTLGVTEADVDTLRLFADAANLLGHSDAVHLARVIGSSMARVAEAIVSSIRVNLEAPLLREASYTDFIKLAEPVAADLQPRLAYAMDRIVRNYLLRLTEQSWEVTPEGSVMTLELAVGFADLVGFTEQSGRLSVEELTGLVDRFEGGVTDTIAALGGRAVKFIGDEVMFTFADPLAACAYSLQLVELAADDAIPDIRVGLACGEVISRYGDYYGPVVNVASRLVEIAPSGAALVSKEVAERVEGIFEVEELPPREVRGVDEPLEHFRLVG